MLVSTWVPGAQVTPGTRDPALWSGVFCRERCAVPSTLGTEQAENERLAKAVGTHGAREKGALSVCPQLLDGGDDRVIFVYAEPSCAAFKHLRLFPGARLEDGGQEETSLGWVQ